MWISGGSKYYTIILRENNHRKGPKARLCLQCSSKQMSGAGMSEGESAGVCGRTGRGRELGNRSRRLLRGLWLLS